MPSIRSNLELWKEHLSRVKRARYPVLMSSDLLPLCSEWKWTMEVGPFDAHVWKREPKIESGDVFWENCRLWSANLED